MNDSDGEGEDLRELDCDIPDMKKYTVFGSAFLIPDRFSIVEPIGTGAYGLVVAAIDSEI